MEMNMWPDRRLLDLLEIEHPIVRECLQCLNMRDGLEIVSMADLPAQAGMGSSSSFTVGLLHALHAIQCHAVTAECLASQASTVEIERLQEPIGKQDQYIAAYGGLQLIRFQPDGRVSVDPVICSSETKRELNRRLLVFYTGRTREARSGSTGVPHAEQGRDVSVRAAADPRVMERGARRASRRVCRAPRRARSA